MLLIILIGFASIRNNPLVRLEALLGLSPSPIERFFGVKSLFSGMTEGIHQFVHLNIVSSIKANIFAPLFIIIIVYSILSWNIPKMDTRKKEYFFLQFL
ncbi:MAG: DUF2752 domain-containing protein [Thiomargarita sp.]|nr:DUF2752 domain-containing protein [Thiomargarita sp.]